jgi:hypothetical protein
MRRRRDYCLDAISVCNALLIKSNSERLLANVVNGDQTYCSGIDWHTIMSEIVQVYANDLSYFHDLLSISESLHEAN